MARAIVLPSEETIKQIQDEIGNRTAQELKQSAETETLYIRKIALDFMKSVEINIEKIKAVEEKERKLKAYRNQIDYKNRKKESGVVDAYMNFKAELEQSITIDLNLEQFFKDCLIFNDKIVEIIEGKPLLTTIVIPDSDGPIVIEMTLEEMLAEGSGVSIKQDVTSKISPQVVGRLQFDINTIKNNLQANLHRDNVLHGASLAGLNLAYDTALATYDEYNPYVFWKPLSSDQWFKMRLTNAGDMAEAYAYFFYLGGEIFLDHLYNNLDTFYVQGVANVDNVSGLYTSDVMSQNYAYAVKSLQASLPGFRQMIVLANKILSTKIASVEDLKKESFKKQYKDAAGTIRKGLRNKVEKMTEMPDSVKLNMGI